MKQDSLLETMNATSSAKALPYVARSDADLMQLASGGDFRAFNELPVRHCGTTYNFVHGVVRNEEEAMGVVCDACASAYLYLGSADGALDAATWFHLNTVRALIEYLEKRGRQGSGGLAATLASDNGSG